MTPVIREPDEAALAEAAALLRRGMCVAFPTETVYGLGADLFNESALRLVYALKGRPSDNPLIAHVLDEDVAEMLAAEWDGRSAVLAQRFWPGPLTLVVRKRESVPMMATAGRDTVALRSPAHPVARALLERFGGAIAAPSANRSGHVSPTTAQHVADDFAGGDEDLMILDGGPCAVGMESTVLDATGETPRVLRPGSVSIGALRDVLGHVAAPFIGAQDASPGTRERHYAPSVPCELVGRDALQDRAANTAGLVAVITRSVDAVQTRNARVIVLPDDPVKYAQRLYAALRDAESTPGVQRIFIERVPEDDPAWAAVHDRLRRATS